MIIKKGVLIDCSLLTLLLLCGAFSASGQNTTVSQDAKFEQLLNEKRKVNSGLTISTTYRIQIFSGSADESRKNLVAFKKLFKNYDGTIIFNTPNYKVIVGDFRTRIEAERNLNLLKKSYPNAFVLKPNR